MIQIDFFDANGRFVVRHKLEVEGSLPHSRIVARIHCRAVFYFYESADTAFITINGCTEKMRRYE